MERTGTSAAADAAAGERTCPRRISGYTGFLAGVEVAHGVDFSGGIPAAIHPGGLLDAVIRASSRTSAIVKLEGDAVFADAPAPPLDGRGDRVLDESGRCTPRSSPVGRARSRRATTSVPRVRASELDLKVVLHRGSRCASRSADSDLLGPAVTVAHRLLKNTVRDRIGYRPYLFVTDAAATAWRAGSGPRPPRRLPGCGPPNTSMIELRDRPQSSVRRRHRTEMPDGMASLSSPAHGRAARLYGRRDLRLVRPRVPEPRAW